jgi:hypothetical protein
MDAAQSRYYFPAMPVKSTLYDRDFYAWSREQVELLRAGKLAEADIEHIAEEKPECPRGASGAAPMPVWKIPQLRT